MESPESTSTPRMTFYVLIWAGLVGIVVLEAFLTYAGLSGLALTISLIALALIEAAAALLYFMHLKYERPLLCCSLIPALVFVLVMFDHLWPDAFRLASQRLPVAARRTPGHSGA